LANRCFIFEPVQNRRFARALARLDRQVTEWICILSGMEIPPTTPSIEEKEPIVDVFEDGDNVKVMAELPGVEEKDVNLKIENNVLTISADTPAKKYSKEVKLPTSIERHSVESKLRNGILEVTLRKAKDVGEAKT